MRKQVALTYLIGYEYPNTAFEFAVCAVATRLCGGCMHSKGIGFWAEDGAEHKPLFDGRVTTEHTFVLELTCEDHKADMVSLHMQAAITAFAERYGVDTDWVHVKRVEFTGMHFSVKERSNSKRALERMYLNY